MHFCISTGPKWVHGALFRALYVCHTHFIAIVSSINPSERAGDSPHLWRLSNTEAHAYLHQAAFSLHFAGARARKKRGSRNRRAVSSFFQNFRCDQSHISQLISRMSRPIFDRKHTCTLCIDVTGCKQTGTMEREQWWIGSSRANMHITIRREHFNMLAKFRV